MTFQYRLAWLCAVSHACMFAVATAAAPPGARVLDADIELPQRPLPVISPDGNWIAYISKGAVWVCQVDAPPPRQVFELPTWEYLLTRPEHALGERSFQAVSQGLTREQYRDLLASAITDASKLQWTRDSKGLIVSIVIHDPILKMDPDRLLKRSYELHYHFAMTGEATKLAEVDRGHQSHASTSVTPKSPKFARRFILLWDRLLWDVTSNTPRATPYDVIVASSTSDRSIAVEQDSRQLVILDENFTIARRIDHPGPSSLGVPDLHWSPDERFVIWRTKVRQDRPSATRSGVWIDLETGESRELFDQHEAEYIAFTGKGGEYIFYGFVVRSHGRNFDGELDPTGIRLTLVPDGDAPPLTIWESYESPLPIRTPMRPAPDHEHFAIAIPRAEQPPVGLVWHLIDRDKNRWRFPGDDTGEFISPYQIVGFATGGQTIVGYDEKTLFAIPLSAIMTAENKVK